MHYAQKKVLAALFAAGMLLASYMPKAHASTANKKPYTDQAAAFAWQEYCSISELNFTKLESLLSKPKIASSNFSIKRINDMRTQKILLVKADKAKYASENTAKLNIVASVEASIKEPVLAKEVKAESQETVTNELNAEILLSLVNEHRQKIGIPALQKDDSLMQYAASRTPQLFDEIFVNGNMHAGFHALNLPYYATENIIYNRSETGAFNWWLNSGVHRAAIQNPEHTHTGIACSGKTCAQIFTSFIPRM